MMKVEHFLAPIAMILALPGHLLRAIEAQPPRLRPLPCAALLRAVPSDAAIRPSAAATPAAPTVAAGRAARTATATATAGPAALRAIATATAGRVALPAIATAVHAGHDRAHPHAGTGARAKTASLSRTWSCQ